MFRKSFLAASVLLALSLTACGGGGGGGGGGSTTAAASKIGGVVAKGIIKNGIVTAYELNADGTEKQVVGTATTDAKGAYSLTLSSSYAGGAILIKLTPAVDGSSQMKCDALAGCGAVAYGAWMDLPAGFSMDAISPPAAVGSEVKVQVTPYSHMAAAAAKTEMAGGTNPAEAVSDGVTKVNAIVGVNILNTPPVDITDDAVIAGASKEAQQYAVFNAAFADVAFAGGDLKKALGDYATEFSDGKFDAGTKLTDLTGKVSDELKDSKNNDVSQEAKDKLTQVVDLVNSNTGSDGSYTPPPADNSNLTEVEKAKTLVQETRTWITSFNDLKSPAAAFGLEAQSIANTLGNDSQAVLQAGFSTITSAVQFVIARKKAGLPIPATVSLADGSVIKLTFVESPTTSLVVSSDNYTGGVKFSFTVAIDQPLTVLSNNAVDMAGKTLTGSIIGTVSNDKIAASLDGTQVSMGFTSGTLGNPVIDNISLNGALKLAARSGGVATGDEVAGAALIELVALNPDKVSGWNQGESVFKVMSLKELKLGDMTVKSAAGSTAGLGIDLVINNAASFDTMSFLQGGNGIWINKCLSATDDVAGFTKLANDKGITTLWDQYYSPQGVFWSQTNATTVLNGLDNSSQLQSYETNDVPANAVAALQSTYLPDPNKWIVDVPYAEIGYNGPSTPWGGFGCATYANVELTLAKKETVSNFLKASLVLTGKMALKGLPEAKASILLDRTGLNTETASIMLSYNGQVLDITTSDPKGSAGSFTVTDSAGSKLVINYTVGASGGKAVTSGSVSVSGKQVGTLQTTSKGLVLLNYNDGTFESLN